VLQDLYAGGNRDRCPSQRPRPLLDSSSLTTWVQNHDSNRSPIAPPMMAARSTTSHRRWSTVIVRPAGLCRPRRQPRPPATPDHPRALAQRDGRAGPALDRGPIGRLRHLEILDAGNVLDEVVAAGIPHVDAESEMSPRRHRYCSLPQFCSASRFTVMLPSSCICRYDTASRAASRGASTSRSAKFVIILKIDGRNP
jgi:hypothetical protein